MSVMHRWVLSALGSLWLAAVGPVGASAQVAEATRGPLAPVPDPTTRSPRLLGMGRLTLADDMNNHLDLWDFAGNPIGILTADTLSTFEVWPSTTSGSGIRRPVGTSREREYLAGRDLTLAFEAWRRSDTTTAYGIYGDIGTSRSDRVYTETSQVRDRFDVPHIGAAIGGRMPVFMTEHLRYSLRAYYSADNTVQEFRSLYSNGTGEYLGGDTHLIPPPNFFDPDEYRISTIGADAGLGVRFGSWLTAALVAGGSSTRFEGENSSLIHSAGTGEDRPYYVAQLSAVGRLPAGLEYAADGRTWTSTSEDRWVFTLKAGINQDPFTGRGKKLDREETGQQGRARVRWRLGSLQLNAAGGVGNRDVEITPPFVPDSANYDFSDPADRARYQDDLGKYQESYNYFIDVAANRLGADSLALPDSVAASRVKERGWDAAYGATWQLGGRALVGAEYHILIAELERLGESIGPRRRMWDVRSGLEYGWTPALSIRTGYVYRRDDRDEFTRRNEFKSHAISLGLGLRPPGSIWGFDAGWSMEWIRPDFDDPTEARETAQRLAAELSWRF